MIEPMGDAELEVWHGVLARREYGSRTLDVYASAIPTPGDAHHG